MDEDWFIENMKDMMNENTYRDDKKDLRKFLFEEIKKKNKLEDIKRSVCKKWKKCLNNLENDYIDRKFIKYCTQFWLDDIHELVTKEIKNKKGRDILMCIDHLKQIKNIPKFFQSSDYYKIFILHSTLIDETLEAILIQKIKLICLEQTINYNVIAKKELEFIGYMASFLDTNYNNPNVLAKIDLTGFVNGEISFGFLLNSIIQLNTTEIEKNNFDADFIRCAEGLQNENEYILLKKIEEIVRDFLKPVEIRERVIDNRTIIEIKSRNLIVSRILNDLESLILKNSDIEEIQFIVSKNLYIDTDLNKNIWHGKNIGIITRYIHIIKNVTWDVSGKSSEHKYDSHAGTENDGRGKDGSDGYPGESGGNVFIVASKIFKEDLILILSNGGNGSDGQNGGPGIDGPNGEGISRSEFKEKFPSVIKFASSMFERVKKVKEIVRQIKDLASTIHCEWYTNNDDPGGCDVFLEVTTRQENQITFSYCRGGLFSRYQGFLLYKGSLGKPGKAGGKNGLGGEGGFSGIIEVKILQTQKEFKIQKQSNNGATGKAGAIGNHGKHGKNSWDMGYIDYQFWAETVVYDSKDNNINIVYYEYNSPNRVFCPYRDACNRYSYAEMEVQKMNHPQQITYEKTERTEDNRQHSSKANKKKNVLTSNLYHDFEIVCLEESDKYKDLNSQFRAIDLLAMQSLSTFDRKLNHNWGVRSNISRITNYNENEKICDRSILGSENKYKILKSTIAESIPSKFFNLTHPKMLIQEMKNLNKMSLTKGNLDSIYKKWNKCKTLFKKSIESEKVELMFLEKYRIAVLQDIALKVNQSQQNFTFCSKTPKDGLSATQAVKYLTLQNKKNTDIHHNELGSFREYIFDNEEKHRKNVIKFCENGFLQTNKEVFRHVFSKLFLEISEKDCLPNKNVKKHFDEYHSFLKDKKSKIIKHYSIFKSELFKSRHKIIMQKLLSRTIDEYAGNYLKDEINQDSFLKTLYKRFNEQFQSTYDWKICFQDKTMLNFFLDFINHQGSQARCYRELLAHIFDINIRVYRVNNKKRFTLIDNHNSLSNNIIYYLYDNVSFSELDINIEYLNLNKYREFMDDIFSKILSDIYAMDDINMLLEYLSKFKVPPSQQIIPNNQIIRDKLNEEKEIDEISKFFPTEERELVKSSLQKIASSLIGYSGILSIILRRFQYEGRYVSIKEIRYLVNVFLSSYINNKKQENTLSWITATVIQSNWMAELILMELESFFMKQIDNKTEIYMYLTKINADILILFDLKLYKCKQQNISISLSYVKDTLYLLSNVGEAYISLEGVELSEWLYILKEYYWINKVEKLFKWNQNELVSVPYYLLSLENMFGMSVVSEFLNILALKHMLSIQDVNTFDGILQNFVDEKWHLGVEELLQLKNVNKLSEWVAKLDAKFYASDTERNSNQLVSLIEGNANTSPNIKQHLSDILNIVNEIKDGKYFVDSKHVWDMSENDIKIFVQQFQNSTYQENIRNGRLLNIINRAIELKRGFRLRDTQQLTILSFLTNGNSTLAQVSTGEGKSLIVVAISILKALNGEKVDIVTSSSVLAVRDAVINKDLYELFNVSVGHNCSEVLKIRKESYSSSNVIYGDLSNFQRDYLLDRFYGENILGDHDFCNIIVDEVDSMLLDKGNNTIYLSHDIAGLDKLECIYVFIWCSINRPIHDATNVSDFMNISKIKESIFYDMYGTIKKSDFDKIDKNLDELKKTKIWNFLVNKKIIEANGRLIAQNISNVNLNELSTELTYLKEHIMYMLRECIERQRFIYVPKYLNHFIEKHLESWIKSAFVAYFMKAGHDYVVDVDRTKTVSDGNPIITIIDRDTGTDQISSQWDNALHQFLQLKHGCKLTMQSLKSVFISNVSYFKLYRKLYGLTGTLGSERERNLLKEVHTVDFLTVPTAKSKKFHEYIPIVCENKEIWIDTIYEEVKTIVYIESRSILIICQFVEDVELLQRILNKKGVQNIYTYTRDYEEFGIAKGYKKLKENHIIIATNLAGRGTDIILTDTLKENGGLHVCLTYLPTNTRTEKQAFGRAARCGDSGTGRLIVVDGSYIGGDTSKAFHVRKKRDAKELDRISSINVEYNSKIKIEEKCFNNFKILFEKIKNHFIASKIEPEVQSILLQCCLDNWAFWLDENTSDKNVKYCNLNESYQLFSDNLEKLTCKLTSADVKNFSTHKCLDLVEKNPIKMVILGKYFMTQNNYEQALSLFNKVIKTEVYFSEAAHYYKAFVISKQINWEQLSATDASKEKRKEFKEELQKAGKLFRHQAERSLYNATMIDKIKHNYPDSIIQIQAYAQQKQIFSNFHNMFIKSIDDILGTSVSFQNFTSIDINEQQAQDVYDNLLREDFLDKAKLKKYIMLEQLEPISRDYGISSKDLKSFLDKYKNKDFDLNVFIKDLKHNICLPSSGKFWSILLEQGILFDEVKYVIVDTIIMNKIDPSYLESLNEKIASGHILTPNTNYSPNDDELNSKVVFIYGSCIKEQKNENKLILYKNDLKAMNPAKFSMFKKKGALSFDKMAHIDKNKINSANFNQYDSIVIEDFSKINISESQANEILSELISEDIVQEQKINENLIIYKLKVGYENIIKIKLNTRQIYTSNVVGLLLSSYAYRIAIQKLQKQLNENEQNITFQLMNKPHNSLVYDLIENEIIKNVKVTKKRNITEKCVKSLLGLPTTKEQFIQFLKNSEIIPVEKAPALFENLISANWIQHSNVFSQVYQGKLYEVTEPDQNRQILNEKFRPFEKSIHTYLNYRRMLGGENSVRSLTKTLNQLKSSINTLSVPENILKPLTDCFSSSKFLNVDELYMMSLNGLDHIQIFKEKKYTTKMLISTAIIFGFGLFQIAVGVITLYYSMGFMTHIGSNLISEGLGDMLFAISAYKSGYFSWNDYMYHKIISLIFSAFTAGVGAIFSWGVKNSRYGLKLLGPTFQETCGRDLVKQTGKMAIIKSISFEALKGVAKCAANYYADALIDKHLQKFCEIVGSTITSNIEAEVDNDKLSGRLETVYKKYGERNAKKALGEITDSFFYKHNVGNNILSISMKIYSGIVKGVKEAVSKRNADSVILLTVDIMSKILTWSNRTKDLDMIATITEDFINNLCKEIDEKLINNKDKIEMSDAETTFCQDKYYDFKREITENWKSILREQSGRVIKQNILSPIFEDCLYELMSFCGKKIKDIYRSTKERFLETKLKELQQQFVKNLENSKMGLSKEGCETEEAIKQKYYHNVLKLLGETKNPILFANMILEDIPMDLTCALASGPVIEAVLKECRLAVPSLCVIFSTKEGVKQQILIGPPSDNRQVVVVHLENNHFQISDDKNSSNTNFESAENDCLFQALAGAIPELRKLGPYNYRTAMAKQILVNPEIQRHIVNGWHKYPIRNQLFGGAKNRKKSYRVDDPESTDQEVKDVADHIYDRYIRPFRVAGTVQRLSKDMDISREEMVREGASEYQDRSSKRGMEYPAAHVIKAVIDERVNPDQHAQAFVELRNILGHTQIVPRFANEYHGGIGGVIDDIQGDALLMASSCDFSSDTPDNSDILNNIKYAFVDAMNDFLESTDRLTESNRRDIERGLERICKTTPEEMYKAGHDGFSGRYRDFYM